MSLEQFFFAIFGTAFAGIVVVAFMTFGMGM